MNKEDNTIMKAGNQPLPASLSGQLPVGYSLFAVAKKFPKQISPLSWEAKSSFHCTDKYYITSFYKMISTIL